jgi:3-keto-L-gulonate-6-phosphate decarboxylase
MGVKLDLSHQKMNIHQGCSRTDALGSIKTVRVEVPVGGGVEENTAQELHNLQLSINIIRVIKSVRLGGVEHVECTHG